VDSADAQKPSDDSQASVEAHVAVRTGVDRGWARLELELHAYWTGGTEHQSIINVCERLPLGAMVEHASFPAEKQIAAVRKALIAYHQRMPTEQQLMPSPAVSVVIGVDGDRRIDCWAQADIERGPTATPLTQKTFSTLFEACNARCPTAWKIFVGRGAHQRGPRFPDTDGVFCQYCGELGFIASASADVQAVMACDNCGQSRFDTLVVLTQLGLYSGMTVRICDACGFAAGVGSQYCYACGHNHLGLPET